MKRILILLLLLSTGLILGQSISASSESSRVDFDQDRPFNVMSFATADDGRISGSVMHGVRIGHRQAVYLTVSCIEEISPGIDSVYTFSRGEWMDAQGSEPLVIHDTNFSLEVAPAATWGSVSSDSDWHLDLSSPGS